MTLFSLIYDKLGYSPGGRPFNGVHFVLRRNLMGGDEQKIKELNDDDLLSVKRIFVCDEIDDECVNGDIYSIVKFKVGRLDPI